MELVVVRRCRGVRSQVVTKAESVHHCVRQWQVHSVLVQRRKKDFHLPRRERQSLRKPLQQPVQKEQAKEMITDGEIHEEAEDTCAICYDALSSRACKLTCKHVFCKKCMEKWYYRQ